MDLFFSQVVNGIGNGVAYAAIALALVLIYRTTGVLNFAQGEMALLATYFTWWLTDQGLPIGMALLCSVVFGVVLGAVIERVLIRPVENSPSPLSVVIVTLGLFLGLNALPQLLFGTDPRDMPKPWPSTPGGETGSTKAYNVGDVRVPASVIALALMLAVVCTLLWFLLQKTRVGLALRAVASNPESSRLVGIKAGTMLMLGWALASGVGALAGPMVAAQQTGFDTSLMQAVLVYAFAATALGGFDSPAGAVIAGLVIGVADALTKQYLDFLDGIELVLPLGLILVVLVLRPEGLFGRKVVERV